MVTVLRYCDASDGQGNRGIQRCGDNGDGLFNGEYIFGRYWGR